MIEVKSFDFFQFAVEHPTIMVATGTFIASILNAVSERIPEHPNSDEELSQRFWDRFSHGASPSQSSSTPDTASLSAVLSLYAVWQPSSRQRTELSLFIRPAQSGCGYARCAGVSS